MDHEETVNREVTPYVATTREIRVSVVPTFLEENSNISNDVYSFAYQITIENLGKETVQLLERHWTIFSNDQQIAEVVGPGVVGLQPVIEGGKRFEYTSGAVIHDTMGYMEGSYTFRGEGGQFFQVSIPRFELIYPMVIH